MTAFSLSKIGRLYSSLHDAQEGLIAELHKRSSLAHTSDAIPHSLELVSRAVTVLNRKNLPESARLLMRAASQLAELAEIRNGDTIYPAPEVFERPNWSVHHVETGSVPVFRTEEPDKKDELGRVPISKETIRPKIHGIVFNPDGSWVRLGLGWSIELRRYFLFIRR